MCSLTYAYVRNLCPKIKKAMLFFVFLPARSCVLSFHIILWVEWVFLHFFSVASSMFYYYLESLITFQLDLSTGLHEKLKFMRCLPRRLRSLAEAPKECRAVLFHYPRSGPSSSSVTVTDATIMVVEEAGLFEESCCCCCCFRRC